MRIRYASMKPTRNGLLDGSRMEVRGELIPQNAKYGPRYDVLFLSGMLAGCASVVDADDIWFYDDDKTDAARAATTEEG